MRFFLLLFLLVVSVTGMAQGQAPLYVIEEGEQVRYPGTEAAFFEDPSAKMTFEEVRRQTFTPSDSRHLNFGYSTSAFWVRLRLQNQTDYNDWRLLLFSPYYDFLDYWAEDQTGGWTHIKTGRSYPFDSRQSYEHVCFTFRPDLPPNATRTIYLRFEGGNPMTIPMALLTHQQIYERVQVENLYYGIYFGVLLVMLLYNAFIFFVLKNKSYLYYVLAILCTLIIFSSSSGYFFRYIHPNLPELNQYTTRIFMGLIVLVTSLFAISFLETRRYAPLIHKIFLVDIVLAVIAIFLTYTNIFAPATNRLLSLHSPLLIVAGIVVWRRGNSSALYYIFAWVFYVAGGILVSLRNSGTLPITLITTHAVEIGSMLEVVLLSLALADRYRVLRREKELATAHALHIQEKANRELEAKVQERTTELRESNEELNQINEELDTTLNAMELQKNQIELQHEQIHASINYAQRIQSALLPSERYLKHHLSDVFVLNRPRDKVSGDFFYTLKRPNDIVLALADCTGHGVPGAFMSMMGVNLMERVFSEDAHRLPDEAVQRLDSYLRAIFASGEERVRDGMDTAVCTINHQEQTLYFAGAKMPLVQVRNGEAIRHKGSKHSVGGDQGIQPEEVPLTAIKWEPGDRFYLFSDGYQDQFGGAKNKKFMSKRFRQLLAQTADLPFAQQRDYLEKTLEKWMEESYERQTDDILVIGFQP